MSVRPASPETKRDHTLPREITSEVIYSIVESSMDGLLKFKFS